MEHDKRFRTATAIAALLFAGVLLFLVQIIGQLDFLGVAPDTVRPQIIHDGIEKAIHSPLFLAETGWYLLLGTLVHTLLLLVPVIIVRDIGRYRTWSRRRISGWAVITTLLFFVLLFMWNSALFPFSDIVPEFYLVSIWPLAALTTGFIVLFAVWLLSRPDKRMALTGVSLLLILFLPSFAPPLRTASAAPDQPNVILIGIDSLRPDHLTGMGHDHASLMPHLEQWLSQAVVYDNAVTPMARTFPALTSLLTAKYPRHNGARVNLTPENRIDLRWTLARYLQQRGYTTAFAIDGARFVNVSRSYGFDILDTPQQGLPDFIFGDLIDSVGTNLLNLFPLSRWLNPVQYGNGAACGSYRPAQFDRILSRLGARMPDTSSLVMAHFDLAHLPYVRKSVFSRTLRPNLPFKSYAPYERGLMATDQQFAHYLTVLKRHNMLRNAVVVVYSDHGEEFGIDKDAKFRKAHGLIGGRLGHGSSIFSPAQNHILLAMQRFKDGQPQLPAGRNRKPALLTDIAPTVLHQLEHAPDLPGDLDGIDLADDVPADRIRYLESSVLMPIVTDGKVDRRRLLKRFGNGFRVTDNLRIRAKDSLADPRLKQRGAIIGNRVFGITATAVTNVHAPEHYRRWVSVKWPALGQTPRAYTSTGARKERIARFFDLPLESSETKKVKTAAITGRIR